MKHTLVLFALASLLVFSGCTSLFHPQAEKFYNQAKGATGQQTALTLLAMMETSGQQAKTEVGESPGLKDLHNQFHALHRTFCDFSDQQAGAPAYEQAVTLNKELKTVFHRLWKFKNDPVLRGAHLDIFLSRVQELRTALQAIPT
jgi:hypothetical protein